MAAIGRLQAAEALELTEERLRSRPILADSHSSRRNEWTLNASPTIRLIIQKRQNVLFFNNKSEIEDHKEPKWFRQPTTIGNGSLLVFVSCFNCFYFAVIWRIKMSNMAIQAGNRPINSDWLLGSARVEALSYSAVNLKLFSKYSNLCEKYTSTSRTDRLTDRQTDDLGLLWHNHALRSIAR